jgi:hypothetical protein
VRGADLQGEGRVVRAEYVATKTSSASCGVVAQRPEWRLAPGVSPAYKRPLYPSGSAAESRESM